MSKGLANELKEAAEADLLFKDCIPCGRSLPLNKFSNNKTKKDGKATQCKECLKAYVRARRKTDEDFRLKELVYKRTWEENNPKMRETRKRWRSLNKPILNAKAARRRASSASATPVWLTEDQVNEIKNLYWLAKDLKCVTGEDYHVDHIIPLLGKGVCGLNVPWNLQILPSDLNLKKSNGY